MDVLVINLERSPDRRAFMEEPLERLAIAYEFFPAVDGDSDIAGRFRQYDRAKCIRRFGAPLTSREIGCYASHYLAWRECVQRNRPVTIVEDDVQLSPAFAKVLSLASERLSEHRLIRLAGLFEQPFRIIEPIDKPYQLVRFLRGPSGMQCYALSPEGAAALVTHAALWTEPVDNYLDRFWFHGVESRAIVPFEAHHRDESEKSSDIGCRKRRRTRFNKVRREAGRILDDLLRISYNIRHR